MLPREDGDLNSTKWTLADRWERYIYFGGRNSSSSYEILRVTRPASTSKRINVQLVQEMWYRSRCNPWSTITQISVLPLCNKNLVAPIKYEFSKIIL